MWVRVAADYLNLDNVAVINFSKDEDGETMVQLETIAGVIKRYSGHEARVFRKVLETLAGESSSDTVYDFPGEQAKTS